MEAGAMLGILLAELIVAILASIWWRRHRSELPLAQVEFARALKPHAEDGTLMEYVRALSRGKGIVYKKRKQSPLYLWAFIAMLAGVFPILLMIFLKLSIHVAVRACLAIILIAPFTALASAIITEESDENKIARFTRKSARQLLEQIESGIYEDTLRKHLQESKLEHGSS